MMHTRGHLKGKPPPLRFHNFCHNHLHLQSCCHLLDEKLNVIATGSKVGNMYYLNCIDEQGTTHAATICCGDTKEKIWHQHFGHLGMKNLQKLATDQLVNGLDYDVTKDIKFCEPYVDQKHHRSSFPQSGGRRATKLLKMVHSDVCGRSYLPNPSAQAGYDTRSIFKRSLTGLNSEFSFS